MIIANIGLKCSGKSTNRHSCAQFNYLKNASCECVRTEFRQPFNRFRLIHFTNGYCILSWVANLFFSVNNQSVPLIICSAEQFDAIKGCIPSTIWPYIYFQSFLVHLKRSVRFSHKTASTGNQLIDSIDKVSVWLKANAVDGQWCERKCLLFAFAFDRKVWMKLKLL